jgi:hypothetical protein
MAYTVKLAGKDSDFPEWTRIDLRLDPHYFPTEKEAEQLAQDLNNQAWEEWDRNHPDADEEEHIAVLPRAPYFDVEETELQAMHIKCASYEQYAETEYKEVCVVFPGIRGADAEGLRIWFGAWRQADKTVKLDEVGTPCDGDGELLSRFNVIDQLAIERTARWAADGYIGVTPFNDDDRA